MVRETRHLWVGNLPDTIREDRILEHFKRYGKVQSIKILAQQQHQQQLQQQQQQAAAQQEEGGGLGLCATVAFIDIKSAAKAHNADNKIEERTLKTDYYEPPASSTATSAIFIHERDDALLGGRTGNSTPYATNRNNRYALGLQEERNYDRPSYYYDRPAESYVGRRSTGIGYHDEEAYQVSRGRSRDRYIRSAAGTTAYQDAGDSRNQNHFRNHNNRQHFEQPSSRYPSSEPYSEERENSLPPRSSGGSNTTASTTPTTNVRRPSLTASSTVNTPSTTASPPQTNNCNNNSNSTVLVPVNINSNSRQKRPKKQSPSQSRSCSRSNSRSRSSSRSSNHSRSSSSSGSKLRSSSSDSSSRSPSPSKSRSPAASHCSQSSGKSGRVDRPASAVIVGSTLSSVAFLQSAVSTPVNSLIPPPCILQSNSLSSLENHCDRDDKRPLGICVRNLPVRSTDTSLKDGLFHEYKKHGKVTMVKVIGQGTDRYAVVCFKKPEDVEKALEVSKDKLFFGCKIEVTAHEGLDGEDNEFRPLEADLDEFHPKATRTLFIGNLEKDITTSELRKHFEHFGEIIEIDIKKQGSASSYAFIQYSDISSVVKAMRKLDGENLGANRVKLGFGKSMPTNCVWLDGIVDTIPEKFLARHFNRFGPVNYTVIDRERGHALVFYETTEFAQIAVSEMRGRILGGKRLQVDYASRECQQAFFEKLEMTGQMIPGDRPWERRERRDFEITRDERETRVGFENRTYTRYENAQRTARGNFRGNIARGTFSSRGRGTNFTGRYDLYHDEFVDRRIRNYDEEFSQGSGASFEDSYEQELREYGYSQRERREYSSEERGTRGRSFSPLRRGGGRESLSPTARERHKGGTGEERSPSPHLRNSSGKQDDPQHYPSKDRYGIREDGIQEEFEDRCPDDQQPQPANTRPSACRKKGKHSDHESHASISPPRSRHASHSSQSPKECNNISKRNNKHHLKSPRSQCSSQMNSPTPMELELHEEGKRKTDSDKHDLRDSIPLSKGVDPFSAVDVFTMRNSKEASDLFKRKGLDLLEGTLDEKLSPAEQLAQLEHKKRLFALSGNPLVIKDTLHCRDDSECNTYDKIKMVSAPVNERTKVSSVVSVCSVIDSKCDGDKSHEDRLHDGKHTGGHHHHHHHHHHEQLHNNVTSMSDSDSSREVEKPRKKKPKISSSSLREEPATKDPASVVTNYNSKEHSLTNDTVENNAFCGAALYKYGEPATPSVHRKQVDPRKSAEHFSSSHFVSQRTKKLALSLDSEHLCIESEPDSIATIGISWRKHLDDSDLDQHIKGDPHDGTMSCEDSVLRHPKLITSISRSILDGVPEMKKERDMSPLSLPLPKFAASLRTPKASPTPLASPRPSPISPKGNTSPKNPVKCAVPVEEPKLELSDVPGCSKLDSRTVVVPMEISSPLLSPKAQDDSSSSDIDISPATSPNRPSIEERIKALDEKFNALSGSTTRSIGSSLSGDSPTTPTPDYQKYNIKRRPRYNFLTPDIRSEPSEIMKSLLAKSTIFDQDSKRLEHINEKYEPKEIKLDLSPKVRPSFRTKAEAKEFSSPIQLSSSVSLPPFLQGMPNLTNSSSTSTTNPLTSTPTPSPQCPPSATSMPLSKSTPDVVATASSKQQPLVSQPSLPPSAPSQPKLSDTIISKSLNLPLPVNKEFALPPATSKGHSVSSNGMPVSTSLTSSSPVIKREPISPLKESIDASSSKESIVKEISPPPPVAAVTKDIVTKDALPKDAVTKDTVTKDIVIKKESSSRDQGKKDSHVKEHSKKESSQSRNTSVKKEDLREQSSFRRNSFSEPAVKETSREHVTKRESLHSVSDSISATIGIKRRVSSLDSSESDSGKSAKAVENIQDIHDPWHKQAEERDEPKNYEPECKKPKLQTKDSEKDKTQERSTSPTSVKKSKEKSSSNKPEKYSRSHSEKDEADHKNSYNKSSDHKNRSKHESSRSKDDKRSKSKERKESKSEHRMKSKYSDGKSAEKESRSSHNNSYKSKKESFSDKDKSRHDCAEKEKVKQEPVEKDKSKHETVDKETSKHEPVEKEKSRHEPDKSKHESVDKERQKYDSTDKDKLKFDSSFEREKNKLDSSFEKEKNKLDASFEKEKHRLDVSFEREKQKFDTSFEKEKTRFDSSEKDRYKYDFVEKEKSKYDFNERDKSKYEPSDREKSKYESCDRDKSKYETNDRDKSKYESGDREKSKYESGDRDKSRYESGEREKSKHDSGDRDKSKYESSEREKSKYDSSDREKSKYESGEREKSKYDLIEKERSKYDSTDKDKSKYDMFDKDKSKYESGEKEKSKYDKKYSSSSSGSSKSRQKHSRRKKGDLKFDFFDEEPVYFSMYDKVKARSSQNQTLKDQAKDLESVRQKFSQLKQSRAKREEKCKSTDWDSDRDSDLISQASSESDNKSKMSHSSGKMKQLKKKKLIIQSSSEDDPSLSIFNNLSPKSKNFSGTGSDSDMECTFRALSRPKSKKMDIYDMESSDAEEPEPQKYIVRKKSRSRITPEKVFKQKLSKSEYDSSDNEHFNKSVVMKKKEHKKKKTKKDKSHEMKSDSEMSEPDINCKDPSKKSSNKHKESFSSSFSSNKQDSMEHSQSEKLICETSKTEQSISTVEKEGKLDKLTDSKDSSSKQKSVNKKKKKSKKPSKSKEKKSHSKLKFEDFVKKEGQIEKHSDDEDLSFEAKDKQKSLSPPCLQSSLLSDNEFKTDFSDYDFESQRHRPKYRGNNMFWSHGNSKPDFDAELSGCDGGSRPGVSKPEEHGKMNPEPISSDEKPFDDFDFPGSLQIDTADIPLPDSKSPAPPNIVTSSDEGKVFDELLCLKHSDSDHSDDSESRLKIAEPEQMTNKEDKKKSKVKVKKQHPKEKKKYNKDSLEPPKDLTSTEPVRSSPSFFDKLMSMPDDDSKLSDDLRLDEEIAEEARRLEEELMAASEETSTFGDSEGVNKKEHKPERRFEEEAAKETQRLEEELFSSTHNPWHLKEEKHYCDEVDPDTSHLMGDSLQKDDKSDDEAHLVIKEALYAGLDLGSPLSIDAGRRSATDFLLAEESQERFKLEKDSASYDNERKIEDDLAVSALLQEMNNDIPPELPKETDFLDPLLDHSAEDAINYLLEEEHHESIQGVETTPELNPDPVEEYKARCETPSFPVDIDNPFDLPSSAQYDSSKDVVPSCLDEAFEFHLSTPVLPGSNEQETLPSPPISAPLDPNSFFKEHLLPPPPPPPIQVEEQETMLPLEPEIIQKPKKSEKPIEDSLSDRFDELQKLHLEHEKLQQMLELQQPLLKEPELKVSILNSSCQDETQKVITCNKEEPNRLKNLTETKLIEEALHPLDIQPLHQQPNLQQTLRVPPLHALQQEHFPIKPTKEELHQTPDMFQHPQQLPKVLPIVSQMIVKVTPPMQQLVKEDLSNPMELKPYQHLPVKALPLHPPLKVISQMQQPFKEEMPAVDVLPPIQHRVLTPEHQPKVNHQPFSDEPFLQNLENFPTPVSQHQMPQQLPPYQQHQRTYVPQVPPPEPFIPTVLPQIQKEDEVYVKPLQPPELAMQELDLKLTKTDRKKSKNKKKRESKKRNKKEETTEKEELITVEPVPEEEKITKLEIPPVLNLPVRRNHEDHMEFLPKSNIIPVISSRLLYEDSFNDSYDKTYESSNQIKSDMIPERDMNSSPCGDQGSEETEIEQDYGEPNDDLDVSPKSPQIPSEPLRCQEPVAEEASIPNTILCHPFRNPESNNDTRQSILSSPTPMLDPKDKLPRGSKEEVRVNNMPSKESVIMKPMCNSLSPQESLPPEEEDLKGDSKEDVHLDEAHSIIQTPEVDKRPATRGRRKTRKYSESTIAVPKYDNSVMEHSNQSTVTTPRTSCRRARSTLVVATTAPSTEARCRRSLRSDPYALLSPPELSSHGSNDSHQHGDKNDLDNLDSKHHRNEMKSAVEDLESSTEKLDDITHEGADDISNDADHGKIEEPKKKRGRRKKFSGDHHPSYLSPPPPTPLQTSEKVELPKLDELESNKDIHRLKESRLWLSISANEKATDQKHVKNNTNVYDVFEFRDSEDEEVTFERDLQQSTSKDRLLETCRPALVHDSKHPAEKQAEKHVEKHVEKHSEKNLEKHSEKHQEKQPEKLIEKHVEKYSEKHLDKHSEKHAERSVEKNVSEKHTEKQSEKPAEKYVEKELPKLEVTHEKEKKHDELKHKSHDEKDLSNKEYVTELSQHGKISITIRLHQRDSTDGNGTSTAEVVKTSEAVAISSEEPKVEHVKSERLNIIKSDTSVVESSIAPTGRQTRKSSRLNAQQIKTTIDETIEDVVKGNIRNPDGPTTTETGRPTRRTRASRRSEEAVARIHDETSSDNQDILSKNKNDPIFIIPDNKVKEDGARPMGFQSSPPTFHDTVQGHADNDTPKPESKISLRYYRISRTAHKADQLAKDSQLDHKDDGSGNMGPPPMCEEGHPVTALPVMKVELPKIPSATQQGKKENGDDDSGDSRSSPTVLIDPVTGFLTPVAKKAEEAARAASAAATEGPSSVITSTSKATHSQSVITTVASPASTLATTAALSLPSTTTPTSIPVSVMQPVTIKISNHKSITESSSAVTSIVTSAHISSHTKELLPPSAKPTATLPPPLKPLVLSELKLPTNQDSKLEHVKPGAGLKAQGVVVSPSHHVLSSAASVVTTSVVTSAPVASASVSSVKLHTQGSQPPMPIAHPVPGWPQTSLPYPGFGPLSPHVIAGTGHSGKASKQESQTVVCHSGIRPAASITSGHSHMSSTAEQGARSSISPAHSMATTTNSGTGSLLSTVSNYSARAETNVITSGAYSKDKHHPHVGYDSHPPEEISVLHQHSSGGSRISGNQGPPMSGSSRSHSEAPPRTHHHQVAFPGTMPSSGKGEHHRSSKSPHHVQASKHSSSFLPQAGFSMPGYDGSVHTGSAGPTTSSGVIAELLQNPHLLQQHKDYMAAAAAAAQQHSAISAAAAERVQAQISGRSNTPGSSSHADISRLGNPTPPHTPTPPVSSATHLLQPPDLHPAHVAAGLHLRHPGQPPMLVSPHPHLTIHPSELSAYFSQQMLLAATHPHYAALHPELRAQQEAQVRAAMGMAATRFGYPAMAAAATPSSNFRQPVEPRLPHPSAAETKSEGKPSVETAKVPADRLSESHSLKGVKGDIERKPIAVDIKRLEEGEIHPSSMEGKHIGGLRPPHVPYPTPVRQLSPHISVSPHERITDSPAVANLYAQGQMRVNAAHHAGRPSQSQQQQSLQDDHKVERHKNEEPEMKPPAAHQNPPSTISSYGFDSNVHKAVSLERVSHTRGVLALKKEPLQLGNPSGIPPPTMPFNIKAETLHHLAEAHKGVPKGFLTAHSAQPSSSLASLNAAGALRVTPMFPGMVSPGLMSEQSSHRSRIPTPQRGSEAPVHQPSPARAVMQPSGLTRTQPQTPPHASQVPAQGDTFLLQRYPVMWQGLLALKNDQAAVQMHFVSGNSRIAQLSLPTMSDGGTPPVRITQRMRLEQTQLEGVARKMQMMDEHCVLLALPCGRDHMDVLQQSNNLRNGFINYLQLKQAAGIVNAAAPGSQQPAYVIHIFPSCEFSDENMARIAPDLLHSVSDIAHLLIIIATV